jgi:hypothetical protein
MSPSLSTQGEKRSDNPLSLGVLASLRTSVTPTRVHSLNIQVLPWVGFATYLRNDCDTTKGRVAWTVEEVITDLQMPAQV